MKRKYETLDEYLDDLDTIKEKAAKATEGMTTQQVIKYYARAAQRLMQATSPKAPRRAKLTSRKA